VEAKWLNYPYNLKLRYTPVEGTFGNLVGSPSDGSPPTTSPLSLHASLAIILRVLCFWNYSRCDPGGQTAHLGRSDRPRRSNHPTWVVRPPWVSVLRPKSKNPPLDGFMAKAPNPACRLRSLAAILHRLGLVYENQPRKLVVLWENHYKSRAQTSVLSCYYPAPTPCSRRHLSLLATMWPALDPIGHWVPSNQAYFSLHTFRST
jgi:hypothetical protein